MSRKNSQPNRKAAPKSSGSIHDRFVRSVFAHIELVAAFLRLYVAPILLKQLDLHKIKLEPTHFFGEEGHERIADLIFSIPLKRKRGSMKVVFVFEHKSERRRSLAFQLLKYLVAVWNKFFSEAKNPESDDFFLPAPLLIVLHNGSKPIIDKPTLEKIIAKVVGTERFIPKFDYELVDLPAMTVEELGAAPLLRVILELLKRATDGTLSDVQSQILEPLAAIRDDEETRHWIQRILRYMDDLLTLQNERFTPERIDRVIRPVYKERSSKMALSFFEEIEARGKAEGKAEMTLAFLRTKFHRIPKKLEIAIRRMSDSIALDSLAAHIVDCKTLDEFAEALK